MQNKYLKTWKCEKKYISLPCNEFDKVAMNLFLVQSKKLD